jgi:hypothetical protein
MVTVIPKQPKKEREQITIKLDRDVLETLEQHCRYLESSRDYVINQCLVFIFRKDRPFSERLAGKGLAVCAEPRESPRNTLSLGRPLAGRNQPWLRAGYPSKQ